MALFDLTEFLKLSSVLNYNLSAASINRYNLLQFIIGDRRLARSKAQDRESKAVIMETFSFLFRAYREKRRRLGPMAVIHPIRTAALLTRAQDGIVLRQVLTALLHDILEDIKTVDFDPADWRELENQMFDILDRLEVNDEERLIENLRHLTKVPGESYYHYIGRLLDREGGPEETVRVKLADRLDNTLDLWIELEDPLEGTDFFASVFQTLFVANYPGVDPGAVRAPGTSLNGARRLYQLFKNAVLLSLIRKRGLWRKTGGRWTLFEAVATASLREAQRTLIGQMGRRVTDPVRLRKLFLEVMEYGYSGRVDLVTQPDDGFMLDGLFSGYFVGPSKKERDLRLERLYGNEDLMVEASLAFVTVFLSFLNDERFYVRGISSEGIEPRAFPSDRSEPG